MVNCPLHYAIMQGHFLCMYALTLTKGIKPNIKDELGRNPLHYLPLLNRSDFSQIENKGGIGRVLEELVNCGANIDIKDDNKETPIDIAKCFEGKNIW